MKRSIAILLGMILLLSFVFVGCQSSVEPPTEEPVEQATEAVAEEPAEPVATPEKTEEPEATEEPAPEFDPADFPIAVIMPLKGHPVHRIVETGFLARAEELGYKADLLGIDTVSEPEYIAICESAITQGYKGVMVWAYGPFIYPTIQKLGDAGIMVMTPHIPIPEGDAPGIRCNFSADPFAYGQAVAKTIGDAVDGKTGSVAITQLSFNTTENLAAEGFTDGMKAYPNITVLAPEEEGDDAPQAIAKAVAIIQKNPDLLGAFGTTGGSPQTWAGAIDQTGKDDLICIGMDYTQQNIDLVKEGKIYGFVAQPLYEEAAMSVDLLDQIFRGEDVPYSVPLDAPVVTKNEVDHYQEIVDKVSSWFE